MLGRPLKKISSDGFIIDEFRYSDVVVGFDEGHTVAALRSKSPKACLLTKVCPGAPVEVMQRELTEHHYWIEVSAETLIINGDGCWGEVSIVGGRARDVRVRCSP